MASLHGGKSGELNHGERTLCAFSGKSTPYGRCNFHKYTANCAPVPDVRLRPARPRNWTTRFPEFLRLAVVGGRGKMALRSPTRSPYEHPEISLGNRTCWFVRCSDCRSGGE